MSAYNFTFLQDKFPSLELLGRRAEEYVLSDPNSSMIKTGMLGESIINIICTRNRVLLPENATAHDKLIALEQRRLIPSNTASLMHSVRKVRNRAVHDGLQDANVALIILKMAYSICQWFMKVYGDPNYVFRPFRDPVAEPAPVIEPKVAPKPITPVKPETATAVRPQIGLEREELALVESDIKAAQANPVKDASAVIKTSVQADKDLPITEAETRMLIDEALRAVGWQADTQKLRYSQGTRPQKNVDQAIAEWPTKPITGDSKQAGYADYALFKGLELVGFIEAKKFTKDISDVIDVQCKMYARHVRDEDMKYVKQTYGEYQVPLVFATNGRPYLEQIKEKSGIWFLDLRDGTNSPQALRGWLSPSGVQDLLSEDRTGATQRLKEEPWDPMLDKQGLSLRGYQIDAIRAVEDALAKGQQKILLAMATGTGKTRTILGLIYRVLKAKRFKRILYLVDRNSLGEQTQDVFKNVKLEQNMPLSSIYQLKELGDKESLGFENCNVQVATIQSMVKRVLYYANGDDTEFGGMPGCNDYDLVVIDEAHRGYILDKELSDEELLYSDQADFQSKYRSVVDYFTGVKIALTATPALHTVTLFGEPVYTYSYRQAVLDGMLVDYDAPHRISTKLKDRGIHYGKGDEIKIYNPRSTAVETIRLPDEIDFDVDEFNRKVVTEDFNRTVLEEIAKFIDPAFPEQNGKTLIYAVNDMHADLVVRVLKDIYTGMGIDNDAIVKITGKTGDGDQKKIREQIRRFKNERYPSIVVTVDLLTTGIDVPEITSLVFLRRVKSRILFEQMLGRATRLCPKISKDHFDIYDAVDAWDCMTQVTNMKPVVQKPQESFADLGESIRNAKSEKEIEFHKENFLGKLRRKQKRMNAHAVNLFKNLTSGLEPEEFIRHVQQLPNAQAVREYLMEHEDLFKKLDHLGNGEGTIVVVSDKKDELTVSERIYGNEKRSAADYLEAFTKYLNENRESVKLLNMVCARPRDLTRASLKELAAMLENQGYTKQQLATALKDTQGKSDSDLSFDIITIIRNLCLNLPLEDHRQKIHAAVEKLKSEYQFTKPQLGWLKRFESYLAEDEEVVLNIDALDTDSRFANNGGFKNIDKCFERKLALYLDKLNEYIFDNPDARS